MRLIDADALIAWIKGSQQMTSKMKCVIAKIETMPDVGSEVHGEWICHEGKWIDFDYYPTKYECSQCHHYVDVASDKKFCPNCGCRMKGADDERFNQTV